MRITDVEAIRLRLPQIEEKCDGTQDSLIVKIHTDEGLTGIGEADTVPSVGKAIIEAPYSHTMATGLRDVLLGKDPFEIERIWHDMYQRTIYYGRTGPVLHTMSAIDVALWDLVGKALKRPVYQLLGGRFQGNIPVYASVLMPETPKEAAAMAEKYVHMGFKAIKFGWGPIGRDENYDIELVKAIRSSIGDEVSLMIDAGLAWDYKTALRMAHKYSEYNIFWLEEPLSPDDITGYSKLSDAAPMYIAAGEQESGRLGFRRLIEEGNIGILQPDLGRCGGLTEAKKIAGMAYDRNKKVVPHAFKSGITVAACAHFVTSIPNAFTLEYTMSDSPLARELVLTPLSVKDGQIKVTDAPGLGVELNDEVVERYRID